jgi:hypothetical protein
MLQIDYRPEASARLQALAARVAAAGNGSAFLMRWGTAVRKAAVQTCLARGGRRFWRQIGRSIAVTTRGGGVEVAANHVAAAQKQFGGAIKARGRAAGGADWLHIPVDPRAEGVPPGRFALGGTKLAWVINRSTQRGVCGLRRPDGSIDVLYALRKKTAEQRPQPFMPSPRQAAEMGVSEALRFLTR